NPPKFHLKSLPAASIRSKNPKTPQISRIRPLAKPPATLKNIFQNPIALRPQSVVTRQNRGAKNERKCRRCREFRATCTNEKPWPRNRLQKGSPRRAGAPAPLGAPPVPLLFQRGPLRLRESRAACRALAQNRRAAPPQTPRHRTPPRRLHSRSRPRPQRRVKD